MSTYKSILDMLVPTHQSSNSPEAKLLAPLREALSDWLPKDTARQSAIAKLESGLAGTYYANVFTRGRQRDEQQLQALIQDSKESFAKAHADLLKRTHLSLRLLWLQRYCASFSGLGWDEQLLLASTENPEQDMSQAFASTTSEIQRRQYIDQTWLTALAQNKNVAVVKATHKLQGPLRQAEATSQLRALLQGLPGLDSMPQFGTLQIELRTSYFNEWRHSALPTIDSLTWLSQGIYHYKELELQANTSLTPQQKKAHLQAFSQAINKLSDEELRTNFPRYLTYEQYYRLYRAELITKHCLHPALNEFCKQVDSLSDDEMQGGISRANKHSAQILAFNLLETNKNTADTQALQKLHAQWIENYRSTLLAAIKKFQTSPAANPDLQPFNEEMKLDEQERAIDHAADLWDWCANTRAAKAITHYGRRFLMALHTLQYTGAQTENETMGQLALIHAASSQEHIATATQVGFSFANIFHPIFDEWKEASHFETNPIKRAFRLLMPVFIILATVLVTAVLLSPLGWDALAVAVAAVAAMVIGGLLANLYVSAKNGISDFISNLTTWRINDRMLNTFGHENANKVLEFYHTEHKETKRIQQELRKILTRNKVLSDEDEHALNAADKYLLTLEREWNIIHGKRDGLEAGMATIYQTFSYRVRKKYQQQLKNLQSGAGASACEDELKLRFDLQKTALEELLFTPAAQPRNSTEPQANPITPAYQLQFGQSIAKRTIKETKQLGELHRQVRNGPTEKQGSRQRREGVGTQLK